jgi:hypothetical protein
MITASWVLPRFLPFYFRVCPLLTVMQGGDKDRRLFYIWIHVGMVPEGVGMQKQYVQRFSRSELDKLDKSAGVSHLSFPPLLCLFA